MDRLCICANDRGTDRGCIVLSGGRGERALLGLEKSDFMGDGIFIVPDSAVYGFFLWEFDSGDYFYRDELLCSALV